MDTDTIAGIASGMGGGIGVIRLSGADALAVAGNMFRTKKYVGKGDWDPQFFCHQKSHTIHYGMIVDEDGRVLDEVIVLLMKAPKSYTCEDVVEIDCHGGPFLVQKILQLCIRCGARLAEPGEFTKRAFLNGRIDLSQAEAVMKMISSQNEFALDSAVKQLEGRVSEYIGKIREKILHDMGFIEAALDDPEHYELGDFSFELLERTKEEIAALKDLLSRFDAGRLKSEGIRTVIVGRPNAGKSSLMNLLMDEERAIVTDIAGTTRDVLEETVRMGSLVLKLADTAGIRHTENTVESLGVEKALDFIRQADFVLYVVDANEALNEEDDKIISLLREKKGLILLNKSDLEQRLDGEKLKEKLSWDMISFSSRTGQGLEQLEEYMERVFMLGEISYNNQIYLTSVRHREAVEHAVESLCRVKETIELGMPEDLLTVDLMDAYRELGLIHGETASEDLINKIFQEFCMGK